MRARILLGVVSAGVLWCLVGAAQEAREPESEAAAVEDALAEPADPDDEADIRDDDDPNDVGQEGLEAPADGPPADSTRRGGERD